MKKIVTIIGARPQIIKSSALSRVIKERYKDQVEEVVVHTGQHYSDSLSTIFFQELDLAQPKYNLEIGSASHAVQTAEMMKGIEEVLLNEKPDATIVYGDTNSTIAAALVSAKLAIPIIHIEAGLRSFNKAMPEEINRLVCDHVSTLLFCPTQAGIDNLVKEGFQLENQAPFTKDNPKVYHCGDIMYDNFKFFTGKIKEISPPYELLSLQAQPFILSTFHRPENIDNPSNLEAIFEGLIALTKRYSKQIIYLPLHPRTRRAMNLSLSEELRTKIEKNQLLKIISPVSYLNMLALLNYCDLVITDSGGLQKEAYFAKKLTVILRNETEWVEIVDQGNGIISGPNKARIVDAVDAVFETIRQGETEYPEIFGDGNSAEFIVEEILKHC